MKDNKIRMTLEGLHEQELILESLKKEFQENERAMTASYHNSAGDGAHDNGEFEFLLGNERRLANLIDKQILKIKNIEIITKLETQDEEIVNLNEQINIKIFYDEDDYEEMVITLVGTDGKVEENKVSVNSSLGSSIFGKKVGEKVQYKVNENTFSVEILGKCKDVKKIKTI